MAIKMPARIAKTPLEKAVLRSLNRHAESGYPIASVLKDLMYGGCASGVIGDMIYYTDTIKFFKKHKKEIGALFQESISDFGQSPAEMFARSGWDPDDPLAMDTNNQNILAWFGYEETARNLGRKMGLDL